MKRITESLSPFQRASLINQHLLLLKLYENETSDYYEGEKARWKNAIRVFEMGYVTSYETYLGVEWEQPIENCQIVLEILFMFDNIHKLLNEMTEKEREKIPEKRIQFHGMPRIEIQLYPYARFLLENEEWRFRNICQIPAVTDDPEIRLEDYLELLKKYNKINQGERLDKEQLKEMIDILWIP